MSSSIVNGIEIGHHLLADRNVLCMTTEIPDALHCRIMSLEAKFAALTLDDAPAVVETIKNEGVEKSGLAANISVLVARCDSKEDAESIAALKTITQMAKECPQAQPFTKETLGACMFQFNFDFSF